MNYCHSFSCVFSLNNASYFVLNYFVVFLFFVVVAFSTVVVFVFFGKLTHSY